MRLEELPNIYRPETLSLIDRAVQQAWQELKTGGDVADAKAKRRLTRTIVALASVGETDQTKLKRFALNASRAAVQD